MKVLHIVKTVVGATWVLEQVRVLARLGIDVTVALPFADRGLAPQYREAGAEVIGANLDFPAQQPWRIPRVLAACRETVEKVQPDIIHCHHVGTTLVARLALGRSSKIPRVFQVAGPLHLESPFFANLDLRLAGRPDYWIATCEWTRRKYLASGVSPNRVFLSYAGTDVRRFTPRPTGALRAELSVGRKVPLVGMVAYMYAPKWFLGQQRGLKGHEDFFAALNLVREERPEVRGVVIGGAWDGANWYEDRLRYLGHAACGEALTFLGSRYDVAELYPDLDLAVVPSHSENCGGAVEPLMCGVPVVATNVGGLPDLICDGETGWLVAPQNPKGLAQAMLDALSDKAEAHRRAREGQQLVRQMFDAERTARVVAAAYENVLNGAPSFELEHEEPSPAVNAVFVSNS